MNEQPVRHNPAQTPQHNSAHKVAQTNTSTTNNSSKSKGNTRQKVLLVILIVALVALIAGVGYLYKKYRDTQAMVYKLSTAQGQQELNKTQIEAILSEMRKLIVVPTGEDPAIATIVDIEQLKSSPFYKDAQNGDRVVLFNNAKKAYIYRPDSKIIVNYAAFQPEEPAQQQQQPATTTPKR